MLSRRQLLCAASLVGSGLVAPVSDVLAAPVLGKDYTTVRPPIDYGRRPIVIHDFFAYTCPHCLQFEPMMSEFTEWVKTQGDIRIVPVPVAWNETYSIFPRAYYAFQTLNRMDELHMPFWQWIIREDHENWDTTQAVEADIAKWVGKHGVDDALWKKTINSFAVVSKSHNATQTWKHYGVDSTPCVGIAGRFITAPHLTGTRRGTIDVIKFLINQIRSEK